MPFKSVAMVKSMPPHLSWLVIIFTWWKRKASIYLFRVKVTLLTAVLCWSPAEQEDSLQGTTTKSCSGTSPTTTVLIPNKLVWSKWDINLNDMLERASTPPLLELRQEFKTDYPSFCSHLEKSRLTLETENLPIKLHG